jgi:mannose/fructose/sorbose-specific phosphotransferase system IIA component
LVGLVIVSHGNLSTALLDAARLIAGELGGIATVSLTEKDSLESSIERVADAMEEVEAGDGVLVLVDLFGGTPFNAGARLALERDNGVKVISGVNLPMLVELAVQRHGLTLEQLVDLAYDAGVGGIRTLSQSIADKESGDGRTLTMRSDWRRPKG